MLYTCAGSNDDLEETVVSEKVHEDMDIVHENKVVNGHDKGKL